MTAKAGEKFSLNYIARGEPTADSTRMRRRVYRLFTTQKLDEKINSSDIELDLGVEIEWGVYAPDWETFFVRSQLRDFLDTITIVVRNLTGRYSAIQKNWVEGIRTIFQQENVGYRVDDLGGVHFAIDAEFEHNQACALAVIQAPRYGAARAHFEAGQRAMGAHPPQTREAIRQTFESIETIFKLMFPVAQLGTIEVTKKLKPVLQERLQGTERDAAMRLAEGLNDWITAAHPYRHGQAVQEPDNPSLTTAVLSISLGASYARWLAELDAAASNNA